MTAIIPAAGEGRRLKPQTNSTPKALLNVAGKPILGHILDELVDVGVDHIVLVVGAAGERIREYVDSHYELRVDYVEQKELQGVGHAVFLAREMVNPSEPLLVVLGDTIFKADFESVIGGPVNTIGVRAVEDPSRFGVVVVKDHCVTRMVEKPDTPVSNLAIVGIYYFVKPAPLFRALEEVIEANIETKEECHLTDALERMIQSGERMRAVTVNGWFDCGEYEGLLRANRFMLDQDVHPMEISGSIIIPPVSIASTAEVERSVIGPYATVGEHAKVGDSIVRDSIVNNGALVENCLLNHSLVGESAVVRGAFKRLNVGDSAEVDFH